MKRLCSWMSAMVVLACLLTSCASSVDSAQEEELRPATVEHLQGPDPTRVTLLEEAAQRLDIQTAESHDVEIGGVQKTVIPYAAVLYDTDGTTWTYTCPEPLVFVRHEILIDSIDGERVILSERLPAGTRVVTVGAEELYGSELEFEEE
jgi:ABC-type oligopeptide transport system substrate-binding subunit